MSKIVVERASGANLHACYRLAYDVFYRELGTLGDAVDHEMGELRDDLIEEAVVLCARSDDEVVGSIAILFGADGPFPAVFEGPFGIGRFAEDIPVERMAINIRFLVREGERASAVPFALITETARLQRERGIALSFADCQPHLLNLYEALGFRACGPSFDQPGFGIMVPLVMITGDDEHLAQVDSPLRRAFGATVGQESYVEAALAVLAERTSVTGSPGTTAIEDVYELLGRPGPGGLFHGLDDDQMVRVLEASHVIECERGQQIVTSEHGTRTLYVVLEGDVEVVSRGVVVHRVGPGQPFGELAFLLSVKRTADVVAASERVRVLALSERVVQRLISDDGELAARLLENLSRALALKLIATSR